MLLCGYVHCGDPQPQLGKLALFLVPAHEPIVEALRQRDPARIEDCLRNHMENSCQRILRSEWDDFEELVHAAEPGLL